MAFPEKLLNPDEDIMLDLRPHWSFWARSAVLFVASLILLGALMALASAERVTNDVFNTGIVVLGLMVVAFCGVLLVLRLLTWRSINMVVTSERMVVRSGLLAKTGVEIPLDRINTVFFGQSLMQRLIGSGNLSVESAGEDGRQDFANVWRPNRVQQVIYEAKEIAEDREHQEAAEAIVAAQQSSQQYLAAAPPAAPVPATIPEQIAQLDELRMRGIITDAEFVAKKTDLLSRM